MLLLFLLLTCLFGIVLIGLLLMTSAIRLNQAFALLAAGFVAAILIWWIACLVKVLLALALAAVEIGIVATVVFLIFTTLIARFAGRWSTNRKGDDHETYEG